jgi:putative Mn2+ efflux pump MntP
VIIGLKMILEARKPACPVPNASFGFKNKTAMAVATSIDALAVGITFAFLKVEIVPAVSIIGVTTFIFSFIGVKIGHLFGAKFESKAEYAGGFILIAIGIKILVDHLIQ